MLSVVLVGRSGRVLLCTGCWGGEDEGAETGGRLGRRLMQRLKEEERSGGLESGGGVVMWWIGWTGGQVCGWVSGWMPGWTGFVVRFKSGRLFSPLLRSSSDQDRPSGRAAVGAGWHTTWVEPGERISRRAVAVQMRAWIVWRRVERGGRGRLGWRVGDWETVRTRPNRRWRGEL